MRYDERDMDAERPDEQGPRAVTVRDLKAYGYSVAITIALISLGTSVLFGSPSLSLSQQTRLYDYVAPVIVLVVGVAAIAALLKNLVPVEKFEKLMVPVGSVVFLATFGYWLLAGPEFRTVTDIEAWYWLIASLWSTSFLAYSFKHALVFNISMATVRLGLILLSTWLKSPPDELDENMIRIVESNLHLAATLTLVAVLGYIKEQWVSVESEAVSLRTMAHIDGLTGVSNRRRTAEILAACLDPRYMACAVVMFDLDDFKRINDQFGHEAGDQVLRRVGTLARGYVRPERLARRGREARAGLLRGVGQRDEIPLEQTRFAAGGRRPVQTVLHGVQHGGDANSRFAPAPQRGYELLPSGLVVQARRGGELTRDGALVLHGVAVDDEAGVDAVPQQPQVQQRPCGQRRDGGGAAAEQGVAVVDVGLQRRGQHHPPLVRGRDAHLHRPAQRDVAVKILLQLLRRHECSSCIV